MTKSLRKEIIFCSRLCNKFPTKIGESKQLYNKQRNLCVTLLREGKRNYFGDIDNIKSFFSSMVDNLKMEYDINRQASVSAHPDPVLQVIETCKYHPSILKNKEFFIVTIF